MIATPLRPSHYLGLLNPLWATHALQARVEAVWDETADARTVRLRPGRDGGRTGPAVRLGRRPHRRRAPHPHLLDLVGAGCRGRTFTLTVKAMRGGRVSPFLARRLQPGAYLPIGLPQGDFVLPDGPAPAPAVHHRRQRHHAGDEHAARAGAARRHAGRRPPALRTASRRRDLRRRAAADGGGAPALSLAPHYTRDAGGVSRHFTPEQLEQACPDWRAREVWACGPPALLAALATLWDAAGLGARLHVERFVAALTPPADAAGGMASFALSQTRVRADGATPLLLVAERVGSARPRLPHGHLPQLRRHAAIGLRARSAQRRLHTAGQRVQVCVCAAAGDVELAL
jgi:ferredoxin-NADP reductase